MNQENFVHDELGNIRWIFQFSRTGLVKGLVKVRNEREFLAKKKSNEYRILIAVFAAISCNLRFAWSFAKSLLFRIRTLSLQLSSDKVLCNRVTISFFFFFSTKLIYRSARAICACTLVIEDTVYNYCFDLSIFSEKKIVIRRRESFANYHKMEFTCNIYNIDNRRVTKCVDSRYASNGSFHRT